MFIAEHLKALAAIALITVLLALWSTKTELYSVTDLNIRPTKRKEKERKEGRIDVDNPFDNQGPFK